MQNAAKPHRVVVWLLAIFLGTFVGGGLALVVNLFVPFLSEAAFALIALAVMAELLILFIAGKAIQVISVLRGSTRLSADELLEANDHDVDELLDSEDDK